MGAKYGPNHMGGGQIYLCVDAIYSFFHLSLIKKSYSVHAWDEVSSNLNAREIHVSSKVPKSLK